MAQQPNITIKPGRLFIDGDWIDAQSGKTCTTINPTTEQPITEVAEGGAEDIDRAVAYGFSPQTAHLLRASGHALRGEWEQAERRKALAGSEVGTDPESPPLDRYIRALMVLREGKVAEADAR